MKTKLLIYVLAFGALHALFVTGLAGTAQGAEGLIPFTGEKSSWHGFDRYDFLMEEQTFEVKPASAKAKALKGQRPCIVVVPKTVAAGNLWSWQACYWDHEPQAEVELLKRGLHIAFVAPDGGVEARDKVWGAWYKFLTEKHGLAKRAAFVGMSKGGVNEYSWGGANPEKVACIYADNPALWDEDFAKLPALAKHDVPLLHVCGSEDFLLDRYTRVVEDMYHCLGGKITVIIKDGHAHHRHSLQNPKLIADWIEQHMTPSTANKPAFVDDTYTKAWNPLMKSLMASAAKQRQPIDNLAALARAGVPVLHDSGALDPWLESQTRVVKKRLNELGGKITVIVKEGEGHFPLSPKDPKSVVDFIVSVGLKSAPSNKSAPQKDPHQQGPAESGKPSFDKNSPFFFDGTISRQSLENYLDHAITMGYFLVPGQPERYQFPYRDDDVRMIRNIGAKFIGRAIYRWGEESKLGDPAFLKYAKKMVERVHSADPEVVFQGCLFEQVTTDINKLKIPAWVFADFGLPVEDRTFSSTAIIKREGRPAKAGGRGGVPIINNLETRLWFYYAAASYINIGCEALHLGQVGLIGADDKALTVYAEFLAKVRSYAKLHARRHFVLMDGHVPSGGMVKDGVSLLDFNSFPMRIKAIAGKPHVPGKPQEAILEVGHLDALFKRSKGCISPSGWKCNSLPYLVEFDNFGRGPNPNVADPKSMFCWGWDEISWFAQQPEEYRNLWLHYAHDWIKRTDLNGHLQMPGARMLTCPNETLRSYFANTKSPACPVGYSQEETIKNIWIKDTPISVKGVAAILYGGGVASRNEGATKQVGDSFRWTGGGQLNWDNRPGGRLRGRP